MKEEWIMSSLPIEIYIDKTCLYIYYNIYGRGNIDDNEIV